MTRDEKAATSRGYMAFSHDDARGKSRTILASTLVHLIGRTATHDMHDRSMRGYPYWSDVDNMSEPEKRKSHGVSELSIC
jgi:hypothetical protein